MLERMISNVICKNDVTKDWIIFLTFLMKDSGIPIAAIYRNNYLNFLNHLLKAAGFDKLMNSSMENVVLYFAIEADCSWKEWVDLQIQMKETEQEETMWEKMPSLKNGISPRRLREFVESGLEAEDNRQTRKTYKEMDQELSRMIQNYKKENRTSSLPDYSDIFSQELRAKVNHVGWRRTWYLYRLLSFIIDKNMENIEKNIENIVEVLKRRVINDEERGKQGEYRQQIKEDFWMNVSGKKLISLYNKKLPDSKEQIHSYLECGSKITCDKLGSKFVDLQGDDFYVYAKYIYPKIYILEKWDEILLGKVNDDKKRKQILKTERILFGTEEKANKFIIEELKDSCAIKRKGRIFESLLSGKTPVSWEMLLLTTLICKKYKVTQVSREYITQMLFNCRFDSELLEDDEHPFIQYYKEAFKWPEKLDEFTQTFASDMLLKYQVSAFHNMVKGKGVCEK